MTLQHQVSFKRRLSDLGKAIELWGKAIRPFLYPSCHRFTKELREREPHLLDTPKLVLFDISSHKIDKVAGRYFYHLAREFIEAGYQPAYRDRFSFVATFKTARYRGFLLGLPFRLYRRPEHVTGNYADHILVTDSASVYRRSRLSKRVLISYEHRRAGEGEVPLTFGFGPGLYRQVGRSNEIDRTQQRDMKIYFAGNTTQGYGKDLLNVDYGMLNRRQVIDAVKSRFGSQVSHPPPVQDDTEPLPPASTPIVLVSKENRRIDPTIWLDTMVRSEFFLACPGVRMPMCHNLVEAIAVGTIPIIEYDEYLEPGLTDGENCIAFRGKEQLISAIEKALNMDDSQVAQMREKVVSFYERFYSPAKMADRIVASAEGGTTLLMSDYRVRR